VEKLGSVVKNWKRRYLVLSGAKLLYFEDENITLANKKGIFINFFFVFQKHKYIL
jgi:hypothetical protein